MVVAPAAGWAELVRYFHGQLHARMDCAEHQRFACFGEGELRGDTGMLRPEIELVPPADRCDVVGDVVVVDKGQRLAALDGDALDREHAALLVDCLSGDQAAGSKANRNDNKESG